MSALLYFRYIGLQLALALILLLVSYGIDGQVGLVSVAIAALAGILPDAYFTLQAFRYKANEDPVKALAALYRGETGKFVLVMVICAVAFKFVESLNPLLLFGALIVILMIQPMIKVFALPFLRHNISDASQTNHLD